MGRTSSEKARVHATRCDYCSCGARPFGNGGRWAHRQMHERRGDGHHGMTTDAWRAKFRPFPELGRRLYAARKAHNWSREMTAGILGPPFEEEHIALAEDGGYSPDSDLVNALERLFLLEVSRG